VSFLSLGSFDEHLDACQQRVQPALLELASSLATCSINSNMSSSDSKFSPALQPSERKRQKSIKV